MHLYRGRDLSIAIGESIMSTLYSGGKFALGCAGAAGYVAETGNFIAMLQMATDRTLLYKYSPYTVKTSII